MDSLAKKAWELETIDKEVAKKIYKKIQNILIHDCVVIPAVDVKVASVRKKSIKGFSSNPAYSTIFIYDLSKN